MTDHERIYLEQPRALVRCWCQDNVFDGGGIEYVRADIVAAQLAEARNNALEEAAKVAEDEGVTSADLTSLGACLRDGRIAAAIRAMKEMP
ncbi:hypothetical protein [Allorhizobium undicola]|uniref:hypothetical protein n=1 Tax=Allorhizobium undicola TaxID=78527 RepID=UPI000483CB34|nr:hypothetical protein [Allorhizobium undicola]